MNVDVKQQNELGRIINRNKLDTTEIRQEFERTLT